MKRIILFAACICLLFSACGGNDGYYYMEEEIIAFVRENEEALQKQIESVGEDGRIEEFDGIEYVDDRRDANGVIYYEYSAFGLMTASLQAGFYYSVEDIPSSRGGAGWAGGYGWSEVQTQEENLWRYEEDGSGDNYLITRKICDHFYYVVAGN